MTTTTTTINQIGAQGDLLLRRVDAIPDGAIPAPDGRIVLAHSETGHDHECECEDAGLWLTDNPLVSYLEVRADKARVVHRRDYDTHAPVALGAGIWEVRRQREHTPEGWRMVQD